VHLDARDTQKVLGHVAPHEPVNTRDQDSHRDVYFACCCTEGLAAWSTCRWTASILALRFGSLGK